MVERFEELYLAEIETSCVESRESSPLTRCGLTTGAACCGCATSWPTAARMGPGCSPTNAPLGHRRLSIVDLAGGAQPLANEDESIHVVFNGEIYNHADLRPRLEAAGHRYHTRSDTETIVHAYEQWGDDCVQQFRGMFAFAIWDAPRRRLLLARDRLGVKPLYWA